MVIIKAILIFYDFLSISLNTQTETKALTYLRRRGGGGYQRKGTYPSVLARDRRTIA
jgi:hypothetical protein